MRSTADGIPREKPWQSFPMTSMALQFAAVALTASTWVHCQLQSTQACANVITTLTHFAAPMAERAAMLIIPFVGKQLVRQLTDFVTSSAGYNLHQGVSTILHMQCALFGGLCLSILPCAAIFVATMHWHSRAACAFMSDPHGQCNGEDGDCTRFISFRDTSMRERYRDRRIDMETMYELYFDERIDFVDPDACAGETEGSEKTQAPPCLLRDVLPRRHTFVRYTFSLTRHLPFLLFRWIPDVLGHSRARDTAQVRDHYDRGSISTASILQRKKHRQNTQQDSQEEKQLPSATPYTGDAAEDDFFGMFLGRSMVYTSGIASDLNKDVQSQESLEDMQRNKMELVCRKLRMKPGDRHLDIGCGWGSLVMHAAKHHGSTSTGVTLSRNQVHYATAVREEMGIDNMSAKFLCMDYRDVPGASVGIHYDKISCLEMAEHVGVKNFQAFLAQVRDMLEDDGVFLLQIAGLRRPFQYEDLVWGLFMAKYIFPGADASMPAGWVVSQLELAGFEVAQVDNIGIHYSLTICKWYENWVRNRAEVVKKHGMRWFRIFEFFLAWSTYIASSGAATCYQITCHKNLNGFSRVGLGVAQRAAYLPPRQECCNAQR
jgi:cyclopropane fatty-acyl-phospholipid synthase-like methyltransferase